TGKPVLVNAAPGTLGNLAINYLRGPGAWNLDLNLMKNIAINERFRVELRIDALNAPNNAQFNVPNTAQLTNLIGDINNINFGRITTTGSARIVVGNLRVNF